MPSITVTDEYIEMENVGSVPATPATDKIRLYSESDTLKQKDDTGTVTTFGSGGGGSDASSITYTPTVLTDWDSDSDPGNTDDALDQLAERVDDLEGATTDASVVTYAPNTLADWDSSTDPGNTDDGLDQLASRLKTLEGAGGGGLFASYAILAEEYSAGTAGGSTSASTWNARTLNTEVYDGDSIVTLSSGKFTPTSGDYRITVFATHHDTNHSMPRLYNVTGTSTVETGSSHRISTADNTPVEMSLVGRFTANGTDEYRIDTYSGAASATDGLGIAVNASEPERYVTVILEKEA